MTIVKVQTLNSQQHTDLLQFLHKNAIQYVEQVDAPTYRAHFRPIIDGWKNSGQLIVGVLWNNQKFQELMR